MGLSVTAIDNSIEPQEHKVDVITFKFEEMLQLYRTNVPTVPLLYDRGDRREACRTETIRLLVSKRLLDACSSLCPGIIVEWNPSKQEGTPPYTCCFAV